MRVMEDALMLRIRLVSIAMLGALVLTATPSTSAGQGADAKVWENYDFVPGSKVVFYTDFSEDRVGKLPQRFTLELDVLVPPVIQPHRPWS